MIHRCIVCLRSLLLSVLLCVLLLLCFSTVCVDAAICRKCRLLPEGDSSFPFFRQDFVVNDVVQHSEEQQQPPLSTSSQLQQQEQQQLQQVQSPEETSQPSKQLSIPLRKRSVSSLAFVNHQQRAQQSTNHNRHPWPWSTSSSTTSTTTSSTTNISQSHRFEKALPSIPLRNFFTTTYTGQISLGKPAQSFEVVFDTGSADIWVLSATPVPECCLEGAVYFEPNKSTSFRRPASPIYWNITYGTGACGGFRAEEVLRLGGLDSLAVPAQLIGMATYYSSFFTNLKHPISGILGMGFSISSVDGTTTVLENLVQLGVVQSHQFSFVLGKDLVAGKLDGSRLILGPPDLSLAPHGFANVSLSEPMGYKEWRTGLEAVTIEGVPLAGVCSSMSSQCFALFDSGTSLIGVPARLWANFMYTIAQKRADCGWDDTLNAVACSSADTTDLPTLSFCFGNGQNFTLHPQDYMIGPVLAFEPVSDWCDPNACTTDRFILGDTFLKAFYTVFDADEEQVMIAIRADPTLSNPFFASSPLLVGFCVLVTVVILGTTLMLVRCKHAWDDWRSARLARATRYSEGLSSLPPVEIPMQTTVSRSMPSPLRSAGGTVMYTSIPSDAMPAAILTPRSRAQSRLPPPNGASTSALSSSASLGSAPPHPTAAGYVRVAQSATPSLTSDGASDHA